MVTLYDYAGRPVRTADLKDEPQTAAMAHLHQEFADHPSRGLTPAKLAAILELAEQGDLTSQARLAEDMEEKDAHLFAELQKRKQGVLTVSWDLVPPENANAKEKETTARIEQMLRDLDMETLLLDMAAGILPGYACIEIDWDRSDGQWMPQALHFRPCDWFMTTIDDRNTLRLRSLEVYGEHLQPFGWIVHHHRAKSGYLARSGLCRVLAWPFIFRNYAARDMAEFLEIYGLPLRLGTYPPGSSKEEKATLMRAVVGIGHAAAGIIPEGMAIEFQEATKGASEPFTAMIDWAEKSVSKAILGATLTSQTDDGGAYALGQVHENVMKDLLRSDLRQYARSITMQLVAPLAMLNTNMGRLPRFAFDTDEAEDLKLYAESVPKLVDVGVKIPERWVREKLMIPEPEGDEPVLQRAQAPSPDPVADQDSDQVADLKASIAGLIAAANTTGEKDTDAVDLQLARLEDAAQQPMAAMVKAVRQIVDRSESLSDLRYRLIEAWPHMDAATLARVMGQALATAQMAGRFDILEAL